MQINLTDILLAGISLLVVGLLVILGQFLYSSKVIKGEYSRKFIHMLSAAWIASWRLFLDQYVVVIMALLLGLGVLFAKRLKIFRAIFSVRRLTNGEISYALGIALTAALFEQPSVYALAIVNLGFADGLAAVIGKKFGRRTYNIFGAKKTSVGAAACFLFAVASGALFWQLGDVIEVSNAYMIFHILAAAALVTAAELIGQKGFDNVMIPVITGLAFSGVIL